VIAVRWARTLLNWEQIAPILWLFGFGRYLARLDTTEKVAIPRLEPSNPPGDTGIGPESGVFPFATGPLKANKAKSSGKLTRHPAQVKSSGIGAI
jgi:hypothetical protein